MHCGIGAFLVGVCLLLLFTTVLASAAANDLRCNPQCDNGYCTAYLGNLSCKCHGNWSGEDCSVFICDVENQCLNGGTCFSDPNNVSQYLCGCPEPYFGSICQFTTEETHSESSCGARGHDPCNGSTCYNLAAGGHQCFCLDGRWGVGCNYSMTDPCLTPDICNGHGRCVWDDTISIYYHARCECEPGWQAALNCKFPHNPRFCHISSATCGDFGTCSYVMGGNGNSTDPNDFRPVDYICTCDGTHQGKNCSEPFDVCDPNPCGRGNCTAIEGGHYYICECPPETTGYNCEYFNDPCESLNCLNGGTCISEVPPNVHGSYNSSNVNCLCFVGFDGTQCERNINTLCLPNPCQNGGHCKYLNKTDSYECECSDDYAGANCELSNHCFSSPCIDSNTETCLTTPEGFACICRAGWGGRNCGDDIDECQDSQKLCLNGGSCVNSPGGYSCNCLPEHTGAACEEYVPQPVDCSYSHMCMNGGTCVDKEGGSMVCNCPLGYAGDICDIVDSDAAGKSPYCGAYNTLILMSTIIVMLEFVYPTLL